VFHPTLQATPRRAWRHTKIKCPEPYAREEVLEACFADLLEGLVFEDQFMDWIVDALHQSHADEKRFRRDALARLRRTKQDSEPSR
jgi:hypothetical protein